MKLHSLLLVACHSNETPNHNNQSKEKAQGELVAERETDRDRQRQTDRQTERQRDRETERETPSSTSQLHTTHKDVVFPHVHCIAHFLFPFFLSFFRFPPLLIAAGCVGQPLSPIFLPCIFLLSV